MTLTAAAEQFVTAEQVRDPDINNCACINEDEPSDADLELMIDEASDMIAITTGFVVSGRRQLIARPCRTGYECACPCCGRDGINLGDRDPVVDMVKIDGVTLAAGNYMLHNTRVGKMLVRLDPLEANVHPRNWPSTQQWWLADTDQHTFSVTFTEGLATDRILIRDAMMEIICDMVTAATKRKNVIPGATAATMGNVSVTLDENRIQRILNGELGPATTKMMGILAPNARQPVAVWSPEIEGDWELNLQFAT